MPVTIRSVWRCVPEAEFLRGEVATAMNGEKSVLERQRAVSVLVGALKVIEHLPKRESLTVYLRRVVSDSKREMYGYEEERI